MNDRNTDGVDKLGAALRSQATRHVASEALRQRILEAVAGEGTSRRETTAVRRRPTWLTTALASAVGGALGASLAFGLAVWIVAAPSLPGAGGMAADGAAAEAVSAHTRALLVGQPIEVTSSDQHTVRPWLSARLNFVPPVADFAAQGFALVGARRDVVGGHTAAVLVYRHGAHLVSAFAEPMAAGETAGDRLLEVRGFHVLDLRQAGMHWRLVSDMNTQEMRQLAALLGQTR